MPIQEQLVEIRSKQSLYLHGKLKLLRGKSAEERFRLRIRKMIEVKGTDKQWKTSAVREGGEETSSISEKHKAQL